MFSLLIVVETNQARLKLSSMLPKLQLLSPLKPCPIVSRTFLDSLHTSISDFSRNPKAQPKKVSAVKPAIGAARGRGARGRAAGRGARRSKPKTADELDAEMTDYFVANGNEATPANGDAVNADLGMDEISVR